MSLVSKGVGRSVLFGFAMLMSATSNAALSIIETVEWGGSTYHIIDSANWYESELAAQSLGGHLVTINSQEENDFIYDYWGRYGSSDTFSITHLWTGLNDEENEGVFVWSSGEDFEYNNFKIGEPNGYTKENHVYMWTRGDSVGTWNDIPGTLGANYQDGIFGVVEVKSVDFDDSASITLVSTPVGVTLFLFLQVLILNLRKKIKGNYL